MSGRITALEPQKRNQERVNVYLDEDFAFGLAAFTAMKLRVGQWLSDPEIAELKASDEVEKARENALNYLAYRPRSEAELRRHLAEKGYDPEAIEEVLTRLAEVGLVDDVAFGQYWVENRSQFKPLGRRALIQELRRKGITPSVMENVLAEHDEEESAYAVAREQARKLAHLPPDQFRRRLSERLARRGFSYDLIQEILAAYPAPPTNSEESEDME